MEKSQTPWNDKKYWIFKAFKSEGIREVKDTENIVENFAVWNFAVTFSLFYSEFSVFSFLKKTMEKFLMEKRKKRNNKVVFCRSIKMRNPYCMEKGFISLFP